MAGLQRSAISFRRQGSSGSVWDDKFLSELEITAKQEEKKRKQQQEGEENLKQGLAAGAEPAADQVQRYRTVKVEEVEDPPSPKLAACSFCVFRNPQAKKVTKS